MTGPAVRELRLLVVGLALVLVSAACGDANEADNRGPTKGKDLGRLTVVHQDDSTATPVEGAFTMVVVRSWAGEPLYGDVVRYPMKVVRDGELLPRRYDLLRDVQLPAGGVIVTFDVWACSAACPNLRTVKPPGDFLGRPEATCELPLEVVEDESREVVVDWEGIGLGSKERCELAS